MLKKGSVTVHQGHAGDIAHATIHDCTGLHINSQAELDALHRLVAEGKPIPLTPAPGRRPPPHMSWATSSRSSKNRRYEEPAGPPQ